MQAMRLVDGWARILKTFGAIAVCSWAAWGCEWKMGAEGQRKQEFKEYMRVGVRDTEKMRLEWRHAAMRADGQTLVGVVIFWGANGYGGYELPTYYHVVVKGEALVFFRETEGRGDVLKKRQGEADYLAEEKKDLKRRLDGFFDGIEWELKRLAEMKVPGLPADLEQGDWTDTKAKRKELDDWKRRFVESRRMEIERAEAVADSLKEAEKEHLDWRWSGEGEYYSRGLDLDVSIEGRVKNIEERCRASRKEYSDAWAVGMGRLERLEERIEEAERKTEAARAQAQFGALAAARERDAAVARAAEKEAEKAAAADEEQRRWRAEAEEKMKALEAEAVRFYADNHSTEASKYEIGDFRRNAAQLLLSIHRMTAVLKEKRAALPEASVGEKRDSLERDIATAERKVDDLWQTLLVGIGVSKHTLQLERQSGRTLPRLKKSTVPFIPGSPSFSRYEPYLRELAGEGR